MRPLRIFLVVMALTLFSCENDDTAFTSEFDQSLSQWRQLKAQFNNSYVFSLVQSSVFGFGSTTTITVQNGVVTQRAFEAYQRTDTPGEKEVTRSWVENQDELNTNDEGAAPMTIDEIYTSCDKDILSVSPDDNFIDFGTDSNGVIQLCTFIPKNCADDCIVGFVLDSFEWL
ncbi:hypothetical protein WIW50_20480 [Flavobacteriaceae bacterium 3-367]